MTALTNRTALITGAGHGAGTIAARALAEAGAHVCVADLNPDRSEAVADALNAAGHTAAAVQGDVSNKFQAAHMIEATRDHFEHLHILVTNAFVKPKDPILNMDEWNWRRSMEVNITGSFFIAQLAARVMADEGGGDIVFLLPQGESVAVKTSVGAVRAFADALRTELAPNGIRVHTVSNLDPSALPTQIITLLED